MAGHLSGGHSALKVECLGSGDADKGPKIRGRGGVFLHPMSHLEGLLWDGFRFVGLGHWAASLQLQAEAALLACVSVLHLNCAWLAAARHHAEDQNLRVSKLHEDRSLGAGDQEDGVHGCHKQGAFWMPLCHVGHAPCLQPTSSRHNSEPMPSFRGSCTLGVLFLLASYASCYY